MKGWFESRALATCLCGCAEGLESAQVLVCAGVILVADSGNSQSGSGPEPDLCHIKFAFGGLRESVSYLSFGRKDIRVHVRVLSMAMSQLISVCHVTLWAEQ